MLSNRITHLLLAGLLLLVGLLFYIQFRPTHILFESLTWLHLFNLPSWQTWFPVPAIHALPSFLHICFMSFLSAALLGLNRKLATFIPLGWLGFDLLLEWGQMGSGNLMQAGVFDVLDVFALLLGCALMLLIFHLGDSQRTASKGLLVAPLLAVGLTTSLGSAIGCSDGYECVTPVVLTFEELRSEIQPTYGNTSPLVRPGKIYAHGQTLYVVDQYRGIHIFDQSDAQNPSRIAYLPIFGALEISIQGSLLYTNSFSDLVVINLSHVLDGSFNINSYSRNEDVFALPGTYEFIPDNTYVSSKKNQFFLDIPFSQRPEYEGEGIVIGFINKQGEEVLFGEFE